MTTNLIPFAGPGLAPASRVLGDSQPAKSNPTLIQSVNNKSINNVNTKNLSSNENSIPNQQTVPNVPDDITGGNDDDMLFLFFCFFTM